MREISYDGIIEDKEALDAKQRMVRSVGSDKVPPLRTYRSDASVMMKHAGTTKSDVVIAETQRREERKLTEPKSLPEKEGPHLGRLIFVLLLVLAFALGIGIYVLIGPLTPGTSTQNAVAQRPPTKDAVKISLYDSPREQVYVDVAIAFKNTVLADGGIRPVLFTSKDQAGGGREVTSRELFSSLTPIPLPNIVLDPLEDGVTYNIHSDGALSGALTVGTRGAETSKGAFFDIEPRLAEMFVPLVNPSYPRGDVTRYKDRVFHDEHIGDTDARVLSDPIGGTLMVYGVTNTNMLIIAGSTAAFRDAQRTSTPTAK